MGKVEGGFFMVYPILCGFIVIIEVVVAVEQAIIGSRCDILCDGRGDEIPTVIVASIGREVFR